MAQAIAGPLIEERGNIMKKRKAWLSGLLAATLVATQVVTAVPMTAFAAPKDLKIESRAVTEVWRHFKSGATNDNGNNAAILKNTNEINLEAGEISFVIKPNSTQANTRFNVGPYIADNANYVSVGYNASGWFWEYKVDGNGSWTSALSGVPVPQANEEMSVSLSWDGTSYTLNADGVENTYTIPEDAWNALKTADIGFRMGTYSGTMSDVLFKDFKLTDGEGNVVIDGDDTWELVSSEKGEVYEPELKITMANVTGRVVDKNGNPVEGVEVSCDTNTTTTDADGRYSFTDILAGDYTISAAKRGYQAGTVDITIEEDDVTAGDIVLTSGSDIEFEGDDVLSSDVMDVAISNTFPQVIGYTMKGGDVDGKKFYGQTTELTQLKVNNKTVTPEVAYEKNSDSKATYTMTIDEQGIDAVVTAVLEVQKNTLSFDITNIEAEAGTFLTVEIPNHNLVTAKASQSGASFAGAVMSNNTAVLGDTYSSVSGLTEGRRGYMYAFVSSDDLSAGLWSNSENNVTGDWQRVTAVTSTVNGVKETGLSSTYWTYQKSAAHRIENKDYEMPSTKVVITGDMNEDDVIDWQDGAVAYRDIMNNPVGAELVPDRVALRIAMNFNGHAQNPFLMTYDNAQKVYLNTDGLGQSILLKGYGSEGHDSGHLNYADVGRRIGGVEEMKKLLAQGKEIGATFGIHVNASETYPESIYFTEDRLKKNADGSLSFGWNWLDQGVNIDADYDLRNGREQRFVDLWEALGGEDNDLDFIYVDVWGNGQSGDNGTWASRQLAKEITQTCGWRLGSEWGHANEYDSTFQHWAADLTYGGATNKGINSYITRFIRNHQKDSWMGDYPSYGGAAVEPLLGGYDMKDFEGWQGRNDYLGYIQNLFDDNLSTKFIQHYKVIKWVNGEQTVVGGANWIPEKEITLKDDEGNKVVLTRKSTNGSSADYKHRIMTYNGRVIMDGEKYLIPWFWDANGNDLADADQKLYHWNQAGGTTTWTLPEGWENVNIYRLTETGNVECNDIATINGNQITIQAQAQTPYVLHKGEGEGIKSTDLTWSKGSHLIDTGFNSNTLDHWDIKGSGAEIVWSAANNMMLQIGSETEETSLTQTITELEPGKEYAAYVGVDNRSDAKAYIEVDVNGEKISNYTERSIAKNYLQSYAHNTNNATIASQGSYFQNMYVFFTAPEEGEVTLTLKREAGAGKTYFDDVRVVNNVFDAENEGNNFGNFNPFISENELVQTFEAVPQGIFPFVIGNVEGVQDNRTHLSEKHAPYTQAGWYNGVKKLDDVLEGNWSLKTNGLTQRSKLLYQTIPQNFRFEEGVTYNISFDYEMGSEGAYAFAVGNGESNGSNFELYDLEMTDLDNAKAKTFRFRLTGKPGDQTWIGIYSTNVAADTQGTAGGAADFGGYKDFILDNLVIEKSKAQKVELEEIVAANSGRYEVNYTPESWEVFADAMEAANAVLEDFAANQTTVDKAVEDVAAAVAALDVVAVTVSGRATEGNKGLANIEITADNGVTTTTDANGNYVLPGVVFGARTLTAESNLFATNVVEIEVSESALEVTQNFSMTPERVRVEGVITAVGEPVEGALVELAGETATTDAQGKYVFENIATRAYTARASMEGYDAATKDVVVVKGETAVINMMLPPLTRSEADYENDYEDNVKTWDNLAGNGSSTAISVGNGQHTISFPGGHANVYETNAPMFTNGKVEMDITSDKAGTRIGILFRAKDMNNRVYVGSGDSASEWFSEYWGSKSGNAWTTMDDGPTFAAGETMHLEAEIVDKTIKLWVNGELVVNNTMSNMQVEPGYFGLNTRAAHTVHIDNVKVTSYDQPSGEAQNVAGRVVDADGNPIEGAKVELIDNNGASVKARSGAVVKATTTDVLGNYKFKNIAFGEYQVRVTANGIVKEIPVTVNAVDGYVVVDKAVMAEVVSDSNKEDLEALIDYAKGQQANPDYQWLVPAVKSAFEAALSEAEAVFNNTGATQEQVDAAYDALLAKVHLLCFIGGDKTDLGSLYERLSKLNLDAYEEEGAKALEAALAYADEVLADENALAQEIADALAGLQAAEEGLVLIPVNKDKLRKLIAEAEGYKAQADKYISIENLDLMLTAAKEVERNTEATQNEVNMAYQGLLQAIFELREVPNKDALKDLIGEVNAMDLTPYTAQSAHAVRAALAYANEVLADETVDQETVDAAVEALNAAVAALSESTVKPSEKEENTGSKGEDKAQVSEGSSKGDDKVASTGNTANTKKPAKTGDSTPFVLWGMMLAAAAGILAIARKKRQF